MYIFISNFSRDLSIEHYTTFDIMSGHNDRWPSRIPTFTDNEPTLRDQDYTTFDIMPRIQQWWPSRIPTFTTNETTLREKYLIIELKKMMIRHDYLNKGKRPSDISEGISPFFEDEWPSSIPTFKDRIPSQREIHLRGEINDLYNLNEGLIRETELSLTIKNLEDSKTKRSL